MMVESREGIEATGNNYHKKHRRCPKCGSTAIEHTCAGYLDIDRNRAVCSECLWKGIVHDLVPEEK